MLTPGRGVTFPSKSASMTSGREGSRVWVGVAEAAGVAVRTKLVAGRVGEPCTATVAATAEAMDRSAEPAVLGAAGTQGRATRLAPSRTMPAAVSTPVRAKARLARMRFFWRLR
jgi:hypothetical protein